MKYANGVDETTGKNLRVPPPGANEHWRFLHDVAVFPLKMVVDNLRDFALIPVSLGAGLESVVVRECEKGGTVASIGRSINSTRRQARRAPKRPIW